MRRERGLVRLSLALALAASACGLRPGPPVLPSATLISTTELRPPPTGFAATPPIAPRTTSAPACPDPRLQVVDLAYPGHVSRGEIPLRVFLPPCFSYGGGPYPVLILFHGKPFDQTHWDEVGLDEAAGPAMQAGDLPPAIMIMPLIPEPLFSQTDGGPDSYEEEALEGLVPFIQATWPVTAAPQGWAIAGISRGGIWALEIGMRHGANFQAAAALSPSLAVNYPRRAYDPLALAAGEGLPDRIFLGAGDTDWARAKTEELNMALARSGREPELWIVRGGHEAATWSALLGPFLLFLFTTWTHSAEGGTG